MTRTGRVVSKSDAYKAANDTRTELIKELLLALRAAAEKGDRAKAASISSDLVREGEYVIPAVRDILKNGHDWNTRVALLSILGRLRIPSALSALEEFYGTLNSQEAAYKFEVVRVVSRMGGSYSRDSLRRLLAREGDPKVHEEIAKTLVAVGMTLQELAQLEKQDRVLIEKDLVKKDDQRTRIESLEKLDPKADESLTILRKAALEESTVAIAILSFRKLEARGDAQSAQILAQRAKAKCDTQEGKIIQTNALSSLSRLTISDARMAYREIVLGEDPDLRRQAISLLGSFGDEAMIPVLEQAAQVDGTPEVLRLTDQSASLIRARASRGIQTSKNSRQ
jgi:hypothetical protein